MTVLTADTYENRTAAAGGRIVDTEDLDERFPRLSRMLLDLAAQGLGTVLGADPGSRARSGIRRVSRPRSPEFADLLVELYRDNYSSLVGYAMRQFADRPRAEDVVQRAFEKVWKRQPDPSELDNPTAYLVTAVRNEINRELRRVVLERQRVSSSDEPGDDVRPAGGADVSTQVADRLALRDELARLPGREREAVVLRMQWQLSVEETAAVMGISTGAVKSYTHHGLRKLKERVGLR